MTPRRLVLATPMAAQAAYDVAAADDNVLIQYDWVRLNFRQKSGYECVHIPVTKYS